MGPASTIPPVPAAAQSGPVSLRTAAGSDGGLPPGEASSNAHASPVALQSSHNVAANSSATCARFVGAAPVFTTCAFELTFEMLQVF